MSDKNYEASWHRHPLFVSGITAIFSLALGGYLLTLIQSNIETQKALINKRLMVIQEVCTYMVKTGVYLRTKTQLGHLTRNNVFPKEELHRIYNNKVLDELNEIYGMEQSIELDLLFYFTTPMPMREFQSLGNKFHKIVDTTETKLKSNKDMSPEVSSYFNTVKEDEIKILNAMRSDIPLSKNYKDLPLVIRHDVN